ncbi:MAG: hypothetical protein H5T76_18940, partial [Streptomyces sp.]|nr:hypothetical protein [Streptomyces sp.]
RIDYGQRAGAEHTQAGARVTFAVVERCDNVTYPSCQSATLNASTAVQWPDVPFDQICTSTTSCSAATQGSPSFFSRKRLHTVTTSVRNAAGTGHDNVDRWTLATAFPSPGDGSSAALALTSIAQSGLGGTAINLPPVTFHTAVWENRVDGIDDAGPLNKHRVYAILTGTGEYLSWEYSAKDCTASTVPTAHTNTKRCFPVYWTSPGASTPSLHWFHKYVVTSVTRTDLSGASAHPQSYSYTYTGSPAWHYEDSVLTPATYRTWSQWRGYELVKVTTGAAGHTRSHSETRYFRGMHGDRATPSGGIKTVSVTDSEGTAITDHWRLQGQPRETITHNGPSGAVVSKELYEPWTTSPTTADDGVRTAMYAGVTSTKVTVPRTSGPERVSQSITTYDTSGLPTSVSDLGDLAITGDDVCTRTSYTRNTTAHILDTVSETRTTAGACTLDPGTAPVLDHHRFYYDGAAGLTTAPTRGNLTKTEQLVDTSSGQSWRAVETTTYDIHGRPTASTDALGKTSTTTYTPATGTPLTTITTTTADPDDGGPLTAHVASTTLDRRWGAPISATAPNLGVTEASLDALGRTTAVWLPGRDRTAHPTAPSAKYAYLLQASGPNAVTAQTLTANSTYTTAITILDGLLRPRQTQTTAAAGAGRIITDTL